jgi:3-hydroxyacyl-CoA dehydrogenase
VRPIQSAAIVGAGVMGAQIAAHLANAGLPVVLFDVTVEDARRGLARLDGLKPPPFFLPGLAQQILPADLRDLAPLDSVDWIVEAVVERLDVKRDLLEWLAARAAPDVVLSSNTSGIPLAEIAAGRSPGVRQRWLGTHFFNPPRYLHLVELIPTPDTAPDVVRRLSDFLDHRLGKGVVLARDTPGFIANRLGLFGFTRVLNVLQSGEFSIADLDALTGPLIGRPRSATFRTADLAGLDVLAVVAADLARRLPDDERRLFEMPPLLARMIERGLLGAKSGRGFYQRVSHDNGSAILTLDPGTLEYRDTGRSRLTGLDAARSVPDTADRLKRLFLGHDRIGAFLRETLGATLVYAARVAPAIADSIDDIDRAMRWGFGWELGPFEIWDAIGVHAVLEACQVDTPPPLVQAVVDAGRDRFRPGLLVPAAPDLQLLKSARDRNRIVKTAPGASLVDLGDGVLCLALHSKLNTIGPDTIAMVQTGVSEAAANWTALVVAAEADAFSAGANLMLLLAEAEKRNWDVIDSMVRAFQRATMALKSCPVPVVAAPAGLALGGGCEICLHADRVQAAAETYMGLVEAGVGLIPAGGGTKEMLLRATEAAGETDDLRPLVRTLFETIGFARVSTSARDARRLGYLRDVDRVTMNRQRLVADAKACALDRVREGYQPPLPRPAVRVGGAEVTAVLSLGIHLARRAGRISDHDVRVGRALARVLAGGDLPHPTTVGETYLLDLEREAFLSLCGEPKTLERIGYTLKTGKPLRN